MCVSAQLPVVVRYSTSFRMMGPSPMMELALGLIHRYVAPTARSSGGAIGVGGSGDKNKSQGVRKSCPNSHRGSVQSGCPKAFYNTGTISPLVYQIFYKHLICFWKELGFLCLNFSPLALGVALPSQKHLKKSRNHKAASVLNGTPKCLLDHHEVYTCSLL